MLGHSEEFGAARNFAELVGSPGGPSGRLSPASSLLTRRARTSRVFFATVWTHGPISGARAIGVALSRAPAS